MNISNDDSEFEKKLSSFLKQNYPKTPVSLSREYENILKKVYATQKSSVFESIHYFLKYLIPAFVTILFILLIGTHHSTFHSSSHNNQELLSDLIESSVVLDSLEASNDFHSLDEEWVSLAEAMSSERND